MNKDVCIGTPSDEILRLAKELLEDPSTSPVTSNPLLQQAVHEVREELDEYDGGLITMAQERKEDDPSRVALELALTRRIYSRQLRIAADATGHPSIDLALLFDLGPEERRILGIIRSADRSMVKHEIAARAGFTNPATVSPILDTLEAWGLVAPATKANHWVAVRSEE